MVKAEFTENPETCVGVHCVTGLGRAPVLVAIALMELGMKYDEAVDAIRNRRRGATRMAAIMILLAACYALEVWIN